MQQLSPNFTQCKRHQGFLSRFKRDIFAVDSTVLRLFLNSIDWARHRRKKAAAKLHMRLNVGTMLPTFAVIDKAAPHDIKHAPSLCTNLKDGDILLADRAYVGFEFMYDLTMRGIFFVLRDKTSMVYETIETRKHKNPRIISDETVYPEHESSKEKHLSKWGLSFSRLVGIMKSSIWVKLKLDEILEIYGTAGAPSRPQTTAEQLYFQGFAPFTNQPMG